jgi:hypothetical protein
MISSQYGGLLELQLEPMHCEFHGLALDEGPCLQTSKTFERFWQLSSAALTEGQGLQRTLAFGARLGQGQDLLKVADGLLGGSRSPGSIHGLGKGFPRQGRCPSSDGETGLTRGISRQIEEAKEIEVEKFTAPRLGHKPDANLAKHPVYRLNPPPTFHHELPFKEQFKRLRPPVFRGPHEMPCQPLAIQGLSSHCD